VELEARHFSETLASTEKCTQRQNPEHCHPHCRENCSDLLRNELAGLNLLDKPANDCRADKCGLPLNNKPLELFLHSMVGKV
jgi:hypothetical protein